jgi:hypothetical protein
VTSKPTMSPHGTDQWVKQMIEALGLDGAKVRRVVIDAEIGKMTKVYVECWGRSSMLEVQPPTPDAVEIIIR